MHKSNTAVRWELPPGWRGPVRNWKEHDLHTLYQCCEDGVNHCTNELMNLNAEWPFVPKNCSIFDSFCAGQHFDVFIRYCCTLSETSWMYHHQYIISHLAFHNCRTVLHIIGKAKKGRILRRKVTYVRVIYYSHLAIYVVPFTEHNYIK